MEEINIETMCAQTIDFAANEGKDVVLKGMVQNLRILSWGAFCILRTSEYTIQTIIDAKLTNIPLDSLAVESAVVLTGTVKKANIKDKALYPATGRFRRRR